MNFTAVSSPPLEKVLCQKLVLLQNTALSAAPYPYRLGRRSLGRLAAALATWVELLLAYRKKVNVVGPTTATALIDQHIMDCLLGLPVFLKLLAATPPSPKQRLADLGSGAGFPGVPLALAFRALGLAHLVELHLIEAKSRKTHFLQASAEVLQLENLKIHQKNILELQGHFHLFTSRAFADLNKTLSRTRHLRRPSSLYLLYKGKKTVIQKELAESKSQANLRHSAIIPLKNPFTNRERHLLTLQA